MASNSKLLGQPHSSQLTSPFDSRTAQNLQRFHTVVIIEKWKVMCVFVCAPVFQYTLSRHLKCLTTKPSKVNWHLFPLRLEDVHEWRLYWPNVQGFPVLKVINWHARCQSKCQPWKVCLSRAYTNIQGGNKVLSPHHSPSCSLCPFSSHCGFVWYQLSQGNKAKVYFHSGYHCPYLKPENPC